ncbi:histamine H2 receptor-like [Asterias rubens]|uniref:histamine H2 receptor-like n=1 Tax=Asterias rubens TaxID=7604 RepID=UPI0014554FEC|nr:histamine H2 receptor-like [Asterias rubens]
MDDNNASSFFEYSTELPEPKSSSNSGWAAGEIENSIVVRTAYALICIAGIIGNVLVCIVLTRVRALRTNTSQLLVHLSVVDILVCIMALPVNVFPTPPPMRGPFGDFLCRFYVSKFMQWACMLASIGSLVVVNLERFIAIVYPLKYKTFFTVRKTSVMILLVWVEALGSLLYFFFVYELDGDDNCKYNGWPSDEVRIVMGVYPYLMHYAGPLILMFAVQWKMITALKKQVNMITQQQADVKWSRRKLWQAQASVELQRTLLFVVITYAICWGPNQTMFFCFMMGIAVDFTHPYYHIGVIMVVMNSCLNPLIYTVRNRPFRRALKELALCRRGGNNKVVPEMPSEGSGSLTLANDSQNTNPKRVL